MKQPLLFHRYRYVAYRQVVAITSLSLSITLVIKMSRILLLVLMKTCQVSSKRIWGLVLLFPIYLVSIYVHKFNKFSRFKKKYCYLVCPLTDLLLLQIEEVSHSVIQNMENMSKLLYYFFSSFFSSYHVISSICFSLLPLYIPVIFSLLTSNYHL